MKRYISIEEEEFRIIEAFAEAAKDKNIGIMVEHVMNGVIVDVNNYPADDSALPEVIKDLFKSYDRTIERQHEAQKAEVNIRREENEKRNAKFNHYKMIDCELSHYKALADDNHKTVNSLNRLLHVYRYALIAGAGIIIGLLIIVGFLAK